MFPQAILDTFHLGEDQQVGTKEQGPNVGGSPKPETVGFSCSSLGGLKNGHFTEARDLK